MTNKNRFEYSFLKMNPKITLSQKVKFKEN